MFWWFGKRACLDYAGKRDKWTLVSVSLAYLSWCVLESSQNTWVAGAPLARDFERERSHFEQILLTMMVASSS